MREPYVVISGTDPSNPHSVADILTALGVLEKQLESLHQEAGRQGAYVTFIRDVLIDMGVRPAPAQAATEAASAELAKLRELLWASIQQARRAAASIETTEAIPSARFGWRPTR